MPADEVTRDGGSEPSRARTGPRHAVSRKPLFTRFHMPAGKAIALAAMPTAVLMGMGFTPTLANAKDDPAPRSLSIDEYQQCVELLEEETASPDASASKDAGRTAEPERSPAASSPAAADPAPGGASSSDPGAGDDAAEPQAKPSASASPSAAAQAAAASAAAAATDPATPTPTPTETRRNVLERIGDALEDLLTGGHAKRSAEPEASESPAADASGDAKDDAGEAVKDSAGATGEESGGAAGKTGADRAEDTADKAVKEAAASKAPQAAKDETRDVAAQATEQASPAASPSASASAAVDLDDCPVATTAEGGVDNGVALPDDPWYLHASSLLLTGADYKGVVKVRTANGTVKRVLKYVVSGGTDIGDLHQIVKDKQSGKTYHVQAAKGSMSTIRNGQTVMYTEKISGNLLGLIPVTFDPDNPPPLNIPLIYFTKVEVVQAGQFGGTLHIPGLHNYITD